jgi:hypothetical protein
MDSTLKTILKVAAVAVVPGAAIFLLAGMLLKTGEERKEREFKKYIHKTYGEGSRYVDNYY